MGFCISKICLAIPLGINLLFLMSTIIFNFNSKVIVHTLFDDENLEKIYATLLPKEIQPCFFFSKKQTFYFLYYWKKLFHCYFAEFLFYSFFYSLHYVESKCNLNPTVFPIKLTFKKGCFHARTLCNQCCDKEITSNWVGFWH